MATQRLKVVCDGPLDEDLNKRLANELSRVGFACCGAGNDPEKNEWYLWFDRPVPVGPSLGPVSREGDW